MSEVVLGRFSQNDLQTSPYGKHSQSVRPSVYLSVSPSISQSVRHPLQNLEGSSAIEKKKIQQRAPWRSDRILLLCVKTTTNQFARGTDFSCCRLSFLSFLYQLVVL